MEQEYTVAMVDKVVLVVVEMLVQMEQQILEVVRVAIQMVVPEL